MKIFFASLILLVIFIFFDGSHFYTPWALGDIEYAIVTNLRLPRTLLAFIVGGCLALSGFVFQSLFKNELASPYTLGTASAASFGACLAFFLNISSPIIFSMTAALMSILFIVWLTSKDLKSISYRTILGGVIVSYFCSSLVMLIQVISNEALVKRMLFWLLGDLNVVGFNELLIISTVAVIYLLFYYYQSIPLSLLSVGHEFAQTKGVNTGRVRVQFLILTALMIGVIVSYCGPIGFIGIIVPHFIRLTKGANIEKIGALLFVGGGLYLASCEYIAQSLLENHSIPVGIITSFSGAPFFLWAMLRRRNI
jgi:iron complex transport system permease protein